MRASPMASCPAQLHRRTQSIFNCALPELMPCDAAWRCAACIWELHASSIYHLLLILDSISHLNLLAVHCFCMSLLAFCTCLLWVLQPRRSNSLLLWQTGRSIASCECRQGFCVSLLTIHGLLRGVEVAGNHSHSNVLEVDRDAGPIVWKDVEEVIMEHHIIPACSSAV